MKCTKKKKKTPSGTIFFQEWYSFTQIVAKKKKSLNTLYFIHVSRESPSVIKLRIMQDDQT